MPDQSLDLRSQSDDHLVQQLDSLEGSECLAELQRRYSAAVTAFVCAIVRDDHQAQDAAQETFERVFLRSHLYQPGTSFRAWLFEIARNQALGALRARRHVPRPFASLSSATEEQNLPLDDVLGCLDPRALEEHEMMQAFHAALAALPERYQEAFRLCGQEGLRYRDAAAKLRVPTGTVAIRMMRARQRLFAALRNHLGHLRRPPACVQ